MEMARSIFGRDHEGYVGREEHTRKLHDLTSACEKPDSDILQLPTMMEELKVSDGLRPCAGGPFSALTPSMWPQDILAKLTDGEADLGPNDPEYRFDEFGFRMEEEDGPEQISNKLLSIPFIEDEQQKMQWIAHLEFSHNSEAAELCWESEQMLPRTEKLRAMVRGGIPHTLRPKMWLHLSGALHKKQKSETSYQDIVKASSNDQLMTSKQIEKDLLRILPTNACFSHPSGTGIPRLRRILRGIAWLFPDIGYCQGTGVIAACLLLFMEEENAFWMMATIVEDLLPASYYSSTLLGIQADQRVMQTLIANYLSAVDESLKEHDIELSLITLHWFLTLFANVVHMKILVRIWDWFFYEGSIVLFQLTLGMLKVKEQELKHLENSAQIFNSLSDIPGEVTDVEVLFRQALEVGGSLSLTVIETHRRRHLAYLMADQGHQIGNPEDVPNLPKQQLVRRQVRKSKSILEAFLFRSGGDSTDATQELKNKNIRQTEILVDLREAILKVGRHFITIEPKLAGHIQLTANYGSESHSRDHENFINVARTRKRRAKALHDFERHDDDELGFRRNDIITIISQKDEHCWVGELNGLRGWFPAKFVELLDERSKLYTSAGDDAISETVTDLVRGTLAPAVKAFLEHGMQRPSFLGGPIHPWLFIEEAATREVEKDFESVYSRLVLCKTYRLDEDGKVLTPEELLYRCVQAINQTHDDAHAQMDVKLRSLICLGLNEQVLHLWLEVLCANQEVVQKWYHSWSFIDSPGWVQIKCELRILSQFAFNLNPDWELPPKRGKESQPLKDGVRDMLVKHHLFSWDL
ncbi:small G protein signaling modulator 3 homolog [Drosophila tropicalis]|uniref:small G protein signaling modulator 3 homolog n=1 Tax=Drosophila tropicalis TaxID=46794 RepID=UPI0035ABE902